MSNDEPDAPAPAAGPAGEVGDDAAAPMPPVQHCPFCGEHVGSFWGRHDADGGVWCESCSTFFRVQVG